MLKPDYHGGSIVNLMASIGGALGATGLGYSPLQALPPQQLRGYRNIVLLLVDGLGFRFLSEQHRDSRLFQHLTQRLTSVFPPTTASAVTSYFTAVAPQQHAITGWFTYLKEAGSVATILPFHPRHGGPSYSRRGLTVQQVIGWPSLFTDGVQRACHVVTAHNLIDSEYSVATGGAAQRRSYRTLRGLFAQVRRLLARRSPGHYIFAYWPKLDTLAHRFGVASSEVHRHFEALDAIFDRFLHRIRGTGTVVIVAADHGLVDTSAGETILLEQHPALARTLTLPLCGEPRAAYCYVHPHARDAFEAYVSTRLGACCDLVPSDQLIAAGYFGLGTPHPRLHERAGDYVLLMRGNHSIKDRVAGEKAFHPIGVHGGLSADELYVPLVVVEC